MPWAVHGPREFKEVFWGKALYNEILKHCSSFSVAIINFPKN